MSGNESTRPAKRSARLWFAALVAILAAVGLLARGIWQRQSNLAELRSVTDEAAVPDVRLVSPAAGPATRTLDLPGTINAWYTAPIYGQVSGYVKMWYKDYGARVKADELLATITTPSLDEELATARANVAIADAKYQLAVVTAKRWKALSGTEAVSQQEVDVKAADAQAARASVEAAQHEVARYEALEQFKRVVAPFDGVVTARRTDVGDYVNATGADAHAMGATELFTVSDIHELRVYVSVPQDYSAMLKPGLTATLSLSQFPGRVFQAKFLTTARAFDPRTRTVITEMTVDNPDAAIWPGTYANVHLVLPADPNVLTIPEQALLFGSQGMQVALVRPDSSVHLQDVKLGLNLGETVQVVAGLRGDDRLIESPSAAILEGQKVQVVADGTVTATPARDVQSTAPGRGDAAPVAKRVADSADQPEP